MVRRRRFIASTVTHRNMPSSTTRRPAWAISPFTGASWLWMGQAILSAVIPMPCPLSWTRQRNRASSLSLATVSATVAAVFPIRRRIGTSVTLRISCSPTINLAQSGDTSAMGVERFDRDVLPFKPSYVIILIGSNSLRAGVPAGEVISDLQTLKEKLPEPWHQARFT